MGPLDISGTPDIVDRLSQGKTRISLLSSHCQVFGRVPYFYTACVLVHRVGLAVTFHLVHLLLLLLLQCVTEAPPL